MASIQAAKESIHIQELGPSELKYVNQGLPNGANWILPTKERPQAFLKDAHTIDVTGEVDRKVAASGIVRVAFNLSGNPRSFGFKDSDVQIGMKLSKEGKYEYQSVQKQIAEMLPMGRKWVTAEFPVKGGGSPPVGGKIEFQLKDETAKVVKGGLELFMAKVEQVGVPN